MLARVRRGDDPVRQCLDFVLALEQLVGRLAETDEAEGEFGLLRRGYLPGEARFLDLPYPALTVSFSVQKGW